MTYASSGVGSTQHLAGALFNQLSGTQMNHVPYKGSGAAIVDRQGVREQRDVAVREDEVVAGGGADRAVARRREAVAVVGRPDAFRRDAADREMAFDGGGAVRIRAVVGHDDLVRPSRLRLERREEEPEVLRAVVDGGEDANLHGAWRARPGASRRG